MIKNCSDGPTQGCPSNVKVGVTINKIEYIDHYPILNYANQSIPGEKVNSFDINTAIKRAMVKAIAMHGIGLYIYAGEDLPVDSKE